MKQLLLTLVTTSLLGLTAIAQDRATNHGTETLLTRGADGWRCLDTGKAPPENWTKTDFDDSDWKTGPAPLGYGEDDIATTLSFGDDSEAKHAVAYFRRQFQVKASRQSETYAALIPADDGAVVHLNGKEIQRLRVPAGTVDHNTFADGNPPEGQLIPFEIKADTFAKGDNTICVSVHQRHGTSSDLVLDMEIINLTDAFTVAVKVNEFLNENPAVARNIEAQNIARENLEWMLRVGHVNREEEKNAQDDVAAIAERAINAAIKIMTDADKLTNKQAIELYEIVFPKDIEWDARYESYLKEMSAVAEAVESGKITKENVMAGIKSRAGEKARTEEEQLDALYQKLLKDEPALGRTPKAVLMPRLRAMLERGEARNLRTEKIADQRGMTFGLYCNELISSGQVERFDKDLKRLYDVGSVEIPRQNRQTERGQAAGRVPDGQRRNTP